MPKISIVVPVYNVEKYLRECIDSIIHQTLEDIEIICVNDGSTDASLEILKDFEKKDNRIKIIDKKNSGYGNSMNMGMDAATGEYVGIVESDDYISDDMFEVLYKKAIENDLDIIKADFYSFVTLENGEHKHTYTRFSKFKNNYNRVFCPRDDLKMFKFTLKIWTGIYRRDFLKNNNIRFNETPGASYQDNGFFFQTFAYADRVMFLDKPLYRYRCDNPDSSINSKEKVYCIRDEYRFIRDVLSKNPPLKNKLIGIYWAKLYTAYCVTFDRIGKKFKKEFAQFFSSEFITAEQNHELDYSLFYDYELKQLKIVMSDPNKFYRRRISQQKWETSKKGGIDKYLKKFVWCLEDNGFGYTFLHLFKRVKNKVSPPCNDIIYICSTYHHVLISIIKQLLAPCRADIIICSDIPGNLKLRQSLMRDKLFRHVFYFDINRIKQYCPSHLISKVLFLHSINKALVELELKTDLKRYDKVYIYHDGTKIGHYLQDAHIPYYLIEDGINHFQVIKNTPSAINLPPENKIKRFLMKIFNIGYLSCGQNKYCRSIEVNDIHNLAIKHSHFLVREKREMYDKLSEKDKERIIKIFTNGSLNNFEINGDKQTVILLTIPLFKDRYVKTKRYQEIIYRDLVCDLIDKGFEVYVKPHPRDDVDYSEIVEANKIIDKNIPTEVFNFSNLLHFNLAVTIFSSSIQLMNFADEKVDLGLDYLVEKYPEYLHSRLTSKRGNSL